MVQRASCQPSIAKTRNFLFFVTLEDEEVVVAMESTNRADMNEDGMEMISLNP